MASDLLREVIRKAFHLLTLVYLAAYLYLPRPALWIGVWFSVVALLEFARLYLPALNRLLLAPFSAIVREEETRQVSGLLHTALGSLLTVLLFGGERAVVVGALLCLAFGDAAAALVGKRFGRHYYVLAGKRKTLEGSAACLLVCLACLLAAGIPWLPALVAAAVGTAVEASPLPVNDNSVLPVAIAAVLHFSLGG